MTATAITGGTGFSVGAVRVPNRLVLAPMAGVTDIVFRGLCKQKGAGLVFTEMVSDHGLIYSNKQSQSITEISESEHPIAAQIFGSDPDTMAKAAVLVAREGPDLIDINMGCPVPKVVKNNEGSALMLNPERAQQIIRAVSDAVRLPVSVKIRKGWDDTRVNAVEFAIACVEAGASLVTVHGRTRSQFYSGRADWQVIARVKEAVSVPVIGNGDIWQPADAQRMLEETGCDGAMIGRGSLGNPWIFSRTLALMSGIVLPPPSPRERIDMALCHLSLVIARRGEKSAIPYMRKHVGWYLKGLSGGARVRDAVNTARNEAEVVAILREYARSFEGGGH